MALIYALAVFGAIIWAKFPINLSFLPIFGKTVHENSALFLYCTFYQKYTILTIYSDIKAYKRIKLLYSNLSAMTWQ